MRNSRRLVGGLVLALMMSTGLSANTVETKEVRDTCVFLAGLLYKVGNPAILTAVWERVFSCDF